MFLSFFSFFSRIELTKEYSWVAMDETAKKDSDIKHLAPSVVHATKSMFIIRVQYYVQIILSLGMLQRAISVKLPFLLKRTAESIPPAKEEPHHQPVNGGKDKAAADDNNKDKDGGGKVVKKMEAAAKAETDTKGCNTELNGTEREA